MAFLNVRPVLPTWPNVITVTSFIVTKRKNPSSGRKECYKHAKTCQRNMERIIEESVKIQQNDETNDSVDNLVLENSE